MKDKRRNTEKRKEKSRDAARCRRGKESEVFYELANCLPMQASTIAQLDKASVMRLSISSLKIQQILKQHHWSDEEQKGDLEKVEEQVLSKALDGFVFILSREGDIVYVNDTVVKYLGIQQIELMGQSIFDFCHPRDEDEIREALSVRSQGGKMKTAETEDRVFFMRLKCTLTSKGRNVNLKSASYKVIKCTGHMVVPPDMYQTGGSFPYLLAVGEPIPHPANIEVPMDTHTFLTKHDMDMKFTYCDDRVKDLLNYSGEDLVGRSLFDYHHAVDSEVVEKAFKDLLSKGQTMTGRYRFMAQGGGWAWVVTQATIIHSKSNHKAQWVVCVHYVISEVEKPELVLSEVQTQNPKPLAGIPGGMAAKPSTESIFSPKTADMDTGYFIPPQLRHHVKLTESNEPEDLSYLAPIAGEVGMPLEIPFPLLTDVSMGNNNNSSSRKEEGASLTPPTSVLVVEGLKQEPGMSPLLCHTHEMQTMASLSPASNMSSSSSSSCSSSRISSPRDYLNMASPQTMHSMDQFFHTLEMKCDAIKNEDRDINRFNDVDRAPYVPMNPDHLWLTPPTKNSLLTLQNDMDPALKGKTEYVFRNKTDNIFDEPPPPPRPSIRDMICGSTAVASIERPPDIMFEQIKRPLDMNSLEKGPPAHKVRRLMGLELLPQLPQVPPVRGQKMLLNLLLKGEDPSGYRTMPLTAATTPRKCGAPNQASNPLMRLTQHDCEVNAPTQFDPLLAGEDLLSALETIMPQTPH